jgi:predicted dehydrogenase
VSDSPEFERSQNMSAVNVAVIGMGYWGPNLARNIAALPGAHLHSICDVREETLGQAGQQYPNTRLATDYEQVLADSNIDAVVIATPAETHYALTKECLNAGKHVLVEKPLARTSLQCRELIEVANAQDRVLMVGHVFLYNAAVQKLKALIDSGELGEVYYISSSRLNLGRIRQDTNALWNFAPHDISIITHLLNATPKQVNAKGFSYIQDGIEDVVFMTLIFPSGVGAHVHISWLDPRKVRTMTVVGSEKMVIYDDVSVNARIQIYDKGVTRKRIAPSLGDFDTFGEFQLLLRAGDLLIPKINFVEPLKVECQHFVDCIVEGRIPITDGQEGLRVVQVLEAAQRSREEQGCPATVGGDDDTG